MPTRYFRAGVGTVVYNEAGQIALFKRAQHPVGIWELQQGGIDTGETLDETLWRELQEEVGLVRDDIETVTEMPNWTIYTTPPALADPSVPSLGQGHHWYFLKLKADREIDLVDALEDEASEFRWGTFDELISLTGDHKQHVYQTLMQYFFDHIQVTGK